MIIVIILFGLAWMLSGLFNIIVYTTVNNKDVKSIFHVIVWYFLGIPLSIIILYNLFKYK